MIVYDTVYSHSMHQRHLAVRGGRYTLCHLAAYRHDPFARDGDGSWVEALPPCGVCARAAQRVRYR